MLSLVRRVLVRSDSLRQAVIDLGCAPEKDRNSTGGDSAG